jgi:hypothetical protein
LWPRAGSRRPGAAALIIALALVSLPVVAGATVEGRWRLVDQTYGPDGSDLLRGRAPVRLELTLAPSGPRGRVWYEGDDRAPVEWPTPLAAPAVSETERPRIELSSSGNRIRARHAFAMEGEPDARLEIVEDYQVESAGSTLVGTVTLRLVRDGEPAGEYVLHRRFERER